MEEQMRRKEEAKKKDLETDMELERNLLHPGGALRLLNAE